jgi:steroid delta-isomerase-like uncharacterized protein
LEGNIMTQHHPAEQNKRIVERFLVGTHNGNVDVVDDLVAPDILTHGFPCADPRNREDYKQFFLLLNAAFPDMVFGIDTLLAEHDKVAVHFRVKGTHRAEFMGILPTGRAVKFAGMVIYRLRDGRIAETWLQPDNLSLLRQLGAIAG